MMISRIPNTLKSLYERNYRLLESIGKSFHLPNDEIHDQIQQLFLELTEKEINFDLINNPDGYLVTAFKRKVIDFLRKAKKEHFSIHEMLHDIAESESMKTIKESEEERNILIESLYKHFKHLPKRCRKVLFMKYYHRLDNEEIAKRTGLSVQSIYNNLSEGIKALRSAFGKPK